MLKSVGYSPGLGFRVFQHCCRNTSHIFDINLVYHFKTWKINTGYTCKNTSHIFININLVYRFKTCTINNSYTWRGLFYSNCTQIASINFIHETLANNEFYQLHSLHWCFMPLGLAYGEHRELIKQWVMRPVIDYPSKPLKAYSRVWCAWGLDLSHWHT